MKKKIIIIGVLIILLILLIPRKNYLNDGGTVEYKALTYKVSKVHSLTEIHNIYNEGTIVEIFGFEIYNSVK